MKRKIVAVIENHFDQIWRRCFRKDFVYNGENYVSYEKIEQYYIEENLKLAKTIPGYKFQIESPCVVENYLARFPEKEKEIKELYANGTLKTMNTGYTILDSNMISAESIIHSYLAADAFFKEYAGGNTPAVANRSDAFGNSAQLPQILKAFGAKHVIEIYYNPYDDEVWVGLDKTPISVKKSTYLGGAGGWKKYKPCPVCKGFGGECIACGGRGINIEEGNATWSNLRLNLKTADSGVIRIGGEELMPNPETPAQIEQASREHGVDITLGHWDRVLELYKEQLEKIEKEDFTGLKVRKSPEFNPNTTGGYVTLSPVKQGLWDTEHKLLSGETWEAIGSIKGKTPRPYSESWKNYFLCAFHDSSAATVVDPAYREVMELFEQINEVAAELYWQRVEGEKVWLFNATATPYTGPYESNGQVAWVKDLAPYSCCSVSFLGESERVQELEKVEQDPVTSVLTGGEDAVNNANHTPFFTIESKYFVIEADGHGLRKIIDKRHGVLSEIVDGKRPFEFILESDVGSPWATLEPPAHAHLLHERTKFVCRETGENYVRLCYKTRMPFDLTHVVGSSEIHWSVTLWEELDRIRFNADVQWETCNKRLRVAFPLRVEEGRDIYGIPGGWLERKPYEPFYTLNGGNGDWPAYQYAGVESKNKSVAVLNRGTPSYKILPEGQGKSLYISLLRSPAMPTYLHETVSYTMKDYDCMRDEGRHAFSFEMVAYNTDFANSAIFADAERFARPPLCVKEPCGQVGMPLVCAGKAHISHIKPAEDGNGIIVRITEHGGVNGTAKVTIPAWVKSVYRTDLPEKKQEKLSFNETLTLKLRAFELATLRLEK